MSVPSANCPVLPPHITEKSFQVPVPKKSPPSKITAVAIVALLGLATLGTIHAVAYCILPAISLSFSITVTAIIVSVTALAIILIAIRKPRKTFTGPLVPISRGVHEEDLKIRNDSHALRGRAEALHKLSSREQSEYHAKCNFYLARLTVALRSANQSRIRNEIEEVEFFLSLCPVEMMVTLQEYIDNAKFVAEWLEVTELLYEELRIALASGDLHSMKEAAHDLWEQMFDLPDEKMFSLEVRKSIYKQDEWVKTIQAQIEIAQKAHHLLQGAKNLTEAIHNARSPSEAEMQKNKAKEKLVQAQIILKEIHPDFKGYISKVFEEIGLTKKRAELICLQLQPEAKAANSSTTGKGPLPISSASRGSKVGNLMLTLSAQKHMYGGGISLGIMPSIKR